MSRPEIIKGLETAVEGLNSTFTRRFEMEKNGWLQNETNRSVFDNVDENARQKATGIVKQAYDLLSKENPDVASKVEVDMNSSPFRKNGAYELFQKAIMILQLLKNDSNCCPDATHTLNELIRRNAPPSFQTDLTAGQKEVLDEVRATSYKGAFFTTPAPDPKTTTPQDPTSKEPEENHPPLERKKGGPFAR